MVLIDQLTPDAVDRYADTLTAVAAALVVGDVEGARSAIQPMAGERWIGLVGTARTTAETVPGAKPRRMPEGVRAEVLIRDRFQCSRCGGRGLARPVLVAVSDVFPNELAYHRNYGRGRVHPAYWALVLEADHTAPHSRGGSAEASNLTAMHALCNTAKADADVHELAVLNRLDEWPDWDGLLSAYPAIVGVGAELGYRHSAIEYHPKWMRLLGVPANDPKGADA
ncbi:MAG: HNH endonuclease [Microbacterium sp.]|uniref:HNH endonuclease n=1 Tax=Microbacterium sp. TaxID=51671 RepID=UPI00271B2ACA|nr:HNH endonuclease [Microbacterium sp.]MDO8382809.1 HNH endonuclease [Microbacterium sp.]